jgi:tetratricopeptide (TPR) repeat protein
MRGLTAIGVLSLTASAWLVWINAPISGGANPSLSIGWLAGVIGGGAGLAWFWRSDRVAAVCGVAGLGLVGFAPLYLALMDPALWDLVDENAQAANIMQFSRHYLPGNYGLQPSFQADLVTQTLIERLATAFYFMSWGWWLCVVGALALLIDAVRSRGRQIVSWVAIAAIVVVIAQGMALCQGVVAQYLQERGDRAMAIGRYAQAIKRYGRAQRWSPQLAKSERVYLRLGEAYYHLEMLSHPSARFFVGYRYFQQRDLQAALAEYLLAAPHASPCLTEVIEKRMAWTHTTRGVAYYRKGEVGPAAGEWERALVYDPAQVQAVYFLSKAYFDQSRYAQSLTMSRLILARSQNRLLNADVQANIGDSYWKLEDFSNARQAYEASMRLDSYANFRIFKSLGGT